MTTLPRRPLPSKWKDRFTRCGYLFGAILLHLVVFLLVATWIVFKAPNPPQDDTFQPVNTAPPPPPPQPPASAGGGSQNDLEPQITVTPPSASLSVTTSLNSSFSVNSLKIPMPNIDSMTKATGSSMAGHGATGTGEGNGNPFGSSTGGNETMLGNFFDFTRSQDGQKTNVNSKAFANLVQRFVLSHWQPETAHPCYLSPNKVFARYLFVPVTPDEVAGAAFQSPDSSHAFWLVHYQANIASNISGKYRFVGFGDNVLVAVIDGSVMLDASDHQYMGRRDSERLGEMPPSGPKKPGTTPIFAGNWFDLETAESHHIDLLIGDEGGVTTSGLFIQSQNGKPVSFTSNGIPKLPLFVIGEFGESDKANLGKFLPTECLENDLKFNVTSPITESNP